jgi:DNA polymerase-3 subunit delta
MKPTKKLPKKSLQRQRINNMKIKPEQLNAYLSKPPLHRLYILAGDEPLLLEEHSKQILAAAKKQYFNDVRRFNVTTGFQWENFSEATQTLSLFSENTCIVLNIGAWKLDATGKECLQHYAKQTNPQHCVIIMGQKLESNTQKTKWFKEIEQHALFCPIWPIDNNRLPQWIQGRAKQLGLTLNTAQANFIAEHTQGNLLAAKQELEKLVLLDAPITDELLETCITYNAQHNCFQLADYCLAGKPEPIASTLLALQQQGTEPTLALWALTKEIRQLSQALSYQAQGMNFREIASKLRIWERKAPFFKTYLQRHDEKTCHEQLQQLILIDKMIKGAIPGDIWRALHQVCLAIAGVNIIKEHVE